MIIAFISKEGNQHFLALKLLARVNSGKIVEGK